ncbi:hypothetical protein A33M_3535 [Rhodovulum sp. PH10]|uniref:hypothetical protein n=1 Tax=Rhodovulum sp. PH10 TaxID=1187851 RepID=UPI00027C214E|nr:hypothetical protein [Rhodovulum sp. PH10]EJW13551.1 hypothetical protein A33M_3535 [Rhodovulum sp. PH10]
MTLDDVKKLTRKTLSAQLAAYGFDDVVVSTGKDQDEDDALFMTATYKSGSALPSGEVLNRTLAILRRELQNAGEERFPYLTHRPEDEATGYDEEGAPE